MQAELRVSSVRSVADALRHGTMAAIRNLPRRLHDWRFWQVQLLVLFATSVHFTLEVFFDRDPAATPHALALTLLVIPLLYAALSFGSEGAILTALWALLLDAPSLWFWHEDRGRWLIEVGQLSIILPVGLIVAWRVDRESAQRLRAERTTAGLSLLNEIDGLLRSVLDVEEQLPDILRRLASGLSVESVRLTLDASPDRRQPVTFGWGVRAAAVAAVADDRTPGDAAEPREPSDTDGRLKSIPLLGKSGRLGSLSVTSADGERLTAERLSILTAAAHAIGVSVENASLHHQRRETLRLYARQVTHAQEEERVRIARELHDDTAQELVSLVRRLERLEEDAAPRLVEQVRGSAQLARSILQGVRRYSQSLRPPVLDDLGLCAAIETVVDDLSRRLPSGAQLRVTGIPRRLPGDVELTLFRIAQEALRNVEKHAHANSATVCLHFDQEVALTIADDGRGFAVPADLSSFAHAGCFGVVGMRERAELFGARLAIDSSSGTGTTVLVALTD